MIRKKLRLDFVAAAALTMVVAGVVVSPTTQAVAIIKQPAPAAVQSASLSAEDTAGRSYIVQLEDPPLAAYRGTLPNLATPVRRSSGKLDVNAPESRAYINYLKQKQTALVSLANAQLGRTVKVNFNYTNALNGLSLRVSPQEADKIAQIPGVKSIRRNTSQLLQTDSGPQWIGAPGVWNGTATGGLPGTKGEGMIIADIDSGISFNNPAFAATGGDGFTATNPFGAGTYLGTCAVGQLEAGKCNDKLIGAYDFIYDVACPGGTCDDGYEDAPGAFDQNGHGTHTASTIAGNALPAAPIQGTTVAISGVAPHANIIAYQVCITIIEPTDPNYGSASCYGDSSVAAVDQAIADGADAINFSIGGGSTPWSDDVSLAFLNAVDAGVFVSASAGNSGPTASTVAHREPWTIGVAAMTHDRLFSDTHVTVTAPTPVPANLAFLQGVNAANDGTQVTAPVSGPLRLSTNNPANDACTATGGFGGAGPAGFIAVIQRGSCNFSEKVANATTAGAGAVIIFNNNGSAPLIMSVPGTTKPAMMISQADGNALKAFITANATAAATIDLTNPPTFSHNPSFGDITASFSSRGPNNGFALMKPEIGGPGVSILAAYSGSNTLVDPTAGDFAFLQGTSMSSPHVAGSAMLVRKLHPTWTPMEVKSALMLTAKNTNLFAENGVTPATPNEVGAGRVDVARASRSPLVMNESTVKMLQADPGATPAGDPSKLNVASLDSLGCAGTCSFTRTVRSVASGPITFNASYAGSGGSTATITPASFTILPGTTKTLTIVVNATAVTVGSYAFGNVNLVPTVNGDDIIFRNGFDGASPAGALSVHLPVAVRSAATSSPPAIVVAPTSLTATQAAGATTTQTLTVSNTGGQPLIWNTAGSGGSTIVAQQTTGGTNGIVSGDFVTSGSGVYSSDDFVVASSAAITELFIDGFANTTDLTSTATNVQFYIYPDAAGVPAGNPEDGLNLETWKFTASLGNAGLNVTNDQITLNLAAAGAPALTLAPGTYWIVAAPTQNLAFNAATRWNWFVGTPLTNGAPAKLIDPGNLFNAGATSWSNITTLTGNAAFAALNYRISGSAPCGASWLSIAPANATTAPAGSTPTTVTFNATGLSAGTYTTSLCFTSNDPVNPTKSVPVTLTVTPGGPQPPTVTKAFAPTSVAIAANSTATITLTNSNATAATLSANLVDTLPSGLVANAGSAATTCTGGAGASVGGAGASVTLGTGAVIPASGSCTVTFTAQSATAGGYTNTIAAGALQTSSGNNATAGSATLTVTGGGGGDVTVDYGFENVPTMFSTGGWKQQNTSSPLGAATYAQGSPGTGSGTSGIESAQAGAANSFAVVNYTSTTGTGTISNWMMTPVITFSPTGQVSFWTRVSTGSEYPDRLEVRVSSAGSSVNVGTSPATVGDFTTLLTTINPTLVQGGYPEVWTQYTFASAQGLPTSGTGRVAFRYYVTDGGPSGDNSSLIAFDTVQIKAAAVATSASPAPVQSTPESAQARQ